VEHALQGVKSRFSAGCHVFSVPDIQMDEWISPFLNRTTQVWFLILFVISMEKNGALI